MTKTYCDKCGKECYRSISVRVLDTMVESSPSLPTFIFYDLCDECAVELNKWFDKTPKKINRFKLP